MVGRAALLLLAAGSIGDSRLRDSVASASAASYDELRAAAVTTCQKIDPAEHQSGLFWNPAGYRSYYVKSECFQRVAREFRDETLCSLVKERHALLSSSWGYSPANCRKLVAEGMTADQSFLMDIKQRYARGPVRLRDFRVDRNGNGRDFDIIPSFSGEFAHGYVLQFELLGANGSVLVHRAGLYVNGSSDIRLFVRQSDLLKQIPQLARDLPYKMRATLVLDIGNRSPSGYWSDAFVERVFPIRDRSQSIERDVRF